MANGLPKDPMLLLSVVNTKLRDYYHNLDALCDDMNVEKEEIVNTLKTIDYEYYSRNILALDTLNNSIHLSLIFNRKLV